ncbi:MAG: hypothetical protein Q9195_002348 [Heterodermia aff. obscurata]
MLFKNLLLLGLSALSCYGVVIAKDQPHCQHIIFTSSVNATIRSLTPAPDLSAPNATENYLNRLAKKYNTAPNKTRQGTYTFAGYYCKAHGDGHSTLQVLAHGSMYTKEYWDRGAWGNLSIQNSYQRFAAEQGHSTLAVDRICNGDSSHPDPELDCQLTTSIGAFHVLFSALRKGTASKFTPIPKELIFTGHSAGSITVSNHVQKYPRDVDTAILTGWPSGPIAQTFAAAYQARHNILPPASPTRSTGFFPAKIGDPARFADLSQGYIISTNASYRTFGYSGSYDPSYPIFDNLSRGTFPLGEISYIGATSFPAFKGRVIVATGDLDSNAWADKDVVEDARAAFPSASNFEWVHALDAGHLVNYHRSAPGTYRKIFQTLRSREFRPEP